MSTSTDQLRNLDEPDAPWPASHEVDAHTMGRYYAARAQALWVETAEVFTTGDFVRYRERAPLVFATAALADLLTHLADIAPAAADSVARRLWAAREAGGSHYPDLMWSWTERYGLPDRAPGQEP